MPQIVSAFLFGYVCGSIPFGLVLTRLGRTADLRGIGSGNIGATNVLRTGRKDLAALTLLLDITKGTAAVIVAAHLSADYGMLAAALGAFLGHLFPVWLKFRGGKGVATYLGCLLAAAPLAAAVFGALWLAIACFTRYSSAAALGASVFTPFTLLVLGKTGFALVFALMTVILWERHRANIARLAKGTESRIGSS